MKQLDSMLLWVCSIIDHRRRLNVVKSHYYGHLLIIAVYCPPHRLWVPMSLLYNSRYNGTSSGRFRYLDIQSWTKVLRTVMQYSYFAVISQFRHKTVHPFSKFSCRSPSHHPIQSWNSEKFWLHVRVQHCLWGEGRGWTCVNSALHYY